MLNFGCRCKLDWFGMAISGSCPPWYLVKLLPTLGNMDPWNLKMESLEKMNRTWNSSWKQLRFVSFDPVPFSQTTCDTCHQYMGRNYTAKSKMVPVVPGQAGGGSFQKEKNYIAQKEFAYRMCARRPTRAMPKSFLCCERAFCRSMVVMFCALKWSVLMSWCLLRGQVMWWSRHLMRCDGLCCVMSPDAKRCHGDELYYSSTTLYYKVLLQYYSVLQILLCTTKYYSNTTLNYTVLHQYYSVLQSITPILLRTTNTTLYYKAYSSTTLYYKVLLQYYPVLQSTTPVLPRTTNTTLYQ